MSEERDSLKPSLESIPACRNLNRSLRSDLQRTLHCDSHVSLCRGSNISYQSNHNSFPTVDLNKTSGSTANSPCEKERNENETSYCPAETPSKKLFVNPKRNFLARLFIKREEKALRECDDVPEKQSLHCESPGKGFRTKVRKTEEVFVPFHNFPTPTSPVNPSTVSIPSGIFCDVADASISSKTSIHDLEFEADFIQHGQPSSADVVSGDTLPSSLRQAPEHGFPGKQQFYMKSTASVEVHYDPRATSDQITKEPISRNHSPRRSDLHEPWSVFSNAFTSEYLDIKPLSIGQDTEEDSHVNVNDTNVVYDKLLDSSCHIMYVCEQSEDEEYSKNDVLPEVGPGSVNTRSEDLKLKGLPKNEEQIKTFNLAISSTRKPIERPCHLHHASQKAPSVNNIEDERHPFGYKFAPSNYQEPHNIFIRISNNINKLFSAAGLVPLYSIKIICTC